MDEQRKMTGQRFTVHLDGESFEVRVTNRELIAWDMTRAKQKWPQWDEARFLALTFVTHRAAVREGITDLRWEAWQAAVEDIDPVAVEDDEEPGDATVGDVTRPTPTAPGSTPL